MAKRIAVVVSQGQSQNPVKRQLEEDIITALIMEAGIDVAIVPHLYDLTPEGTGMLALQGVKGDLVVVSWLYPRAALWVLDRNGVHGHPGLSELTLEEDDEDEDDELEDEQEEAKERVIDQRDIPDRKIYCLDLRASDNAADFVAEVKRIAGEANTQLVSLDSWIGGAPVDDPLERFHNPTNDTALGVAAGGNGSGNGDGRDEAPSGPLRIDDTPARRWYPVIDYSRCTNCMECIDFCLFGVYGVDSAETILVELADNCRKGCPACSRVCPENAIMFPQHKTPTIAGSPATDAGLKIDLSLLFGGEDALEVAALERDEQLLAAGRDAVGTTVGMPKRQADSAGEPKDDLDDLVDELDEMDL